MPYIGNEVGNRFVASKAASVYSGNGSTTAFTLEHAVGSDEDILVSVDGVIQEPSVAYAVSSGTTLTFTAAPSSNSGNNIFVYYLFRTVATVDHPSTSSLQATDGTFSSTLNVTGVLTGTSLDISGDIDVDGTTNLDAVDIDGTLNVQGETTLQTHLNMGDNDKIKLGASQDLEIYHDGNDSNIADVGTGTLLLKTDGAGIYLQKGSSETLAQFKTDGAVNLYYDNSKKLETVSDGINITGGVRLGGNNAANKLNDYEEGTWTPALSNYGGTATIGAAVYTKVGRQVTCSVSIDLDGTSDGSNFQITGLPFTSGNFSSTAVFGAFMTYSNTTFEKPIRFLIGSANTNINVYTQSGGAASYNGLGNDKTFRLVIIYFTS